MCRFATIFIKADIASLIGFDRRRRRASTASDYNKNCRRRRHRSSISEAISMLYKKFVPAGHTCQSSQLPAPSSKLRHKCSTSLFSHYEYSQSFLFHRYRHDPHVCPRARRDVSFGEKFAFRDAAGRDVGARARVGMPVSYHARHGRRGGFHPKLARRFFRAHVRGRGVSALSRVGRFSCAGRGFNGGFGNGFLQ